MKHLKDDDLLARLYEGESHPAETHLVRCRECSGRLAAMELRRAESAAESQEDRIDADFLAEQRRAIYARMDQPTPARVPWAPALAAASLLAIGILMYHPAHPVASHRAPAPAARPEQNQEQLFSDVFSDVFTMEQAAEPRAAAPIRALFEDQAPEQQ